MRIGSCRYPTAGDAHVWVFNLHDGAWSTALRNRNGQAYGFFSARRVANFATLTMARSCVPSPIFSFSSQASTRK